MNRQERDEWVQALRSGDFKQGFFKLHHHSSDNTDTFCCLGVKCELDVQAGRYGIVKIDGLVRSGDAYTVRYGIPQDDEYNSKLFGQAMPPDVIIEAWGIANMLVERLAAMNDGNTEGIRRHTFSEIADWIEEHIPTKEDSNE
jgi:hypothetical protein